MERLCWLLVALATALLLEACLARPQHPQPYDDDEARFFHHKKKKKPLLGSDCKGRTFVYVYNQIAGYGGGGPGGLGGEGDGGGDDGDDGDDDGDDGGDYASSDAQQQGDDCGGGGGLLGHGGLLGGLLGGGTRTTLGFRPQRYLRYFYRAIRPLYRFF